MYIFSVPNWGKMPERLFTSLLTWILAWDPYTLNMWGTEQQERAQQTMIVPEILQCSRETLDSSGSRRFWIPEEEITIGNVYARVKTNIPVQGLWSFKTLYPHLLMMAFP